MKQRIVTAEDVAAATGEPVEDIEQGFKRIGDDQRAVSNDDSENSV